MKTRIYTLALLTLFAAAACNKAPEAAVPAPGELVTIRAILPEDDAVKGAGLTTLLSWTWNDDDKLTVVGETTEVFTIKEGFTPKQAEFVGKPVQGTSFKIYFPGEEAAETDWSEQVQKGNNNLDHLRYEALLDGVDSYAEFAFSPAWAEEHGGTLKQVGVWKFDLTMPADITTASKLTLSADSPVFCKGNGEEKVEEISLTLQDVTIAAGKPLTAWMMASWNDMPVPAGTVMTVSVLAEGKTLMQDLAIAGESSLKTGMVNTITLSDAEEWASGVSHYASGKGTESKPWVITTADQMLYIAEDLLSGATRYFKLGADIDMTGIEWTPLNTASPYDKQIHFDGDGHTISNFTCAADESGETYPSMFGVLYGTVCNVKFVNASISSNQSTACGVVAGYCGTSGKPGKMENVHVEGTVTNSGAYAGIGGLCGKLSDNGLIKGCSMKGTITSTGTKNGVGGIVGIPQNSEIALTWADVTITNNGNYVGGIIGYENGKMNIHDCWSSGSITSNQRIGGIAGGLIKNDSAIRNCYSTCSLTAAISMGGIVGHASLDRWTATTSEPGNVVEKCIAWNTFIHTTQTPQEEYPTSSNGSSGAVVGYTSVKNYLTDCLRKSDLDFIEGWMGNVPYDQANASPTTPLVEAQSQTNNFPYHGKAAASGATLSAAAQSLSWSAEVWDFSGDTPKLK